jgi:transcriptional regulator with XRE-family HTH domain
MTSGERIKAARKAQALSQEKVAALAGVSYRTVHAAEQDAGVRDSTLKAIGKALGIPWDELRAEESVA